MKYKNTTGKETQVRLDDGMGCYKWKFIQPNEELEMPDLYALNLRFSHVEVPAKATEAIIGEIKVETKIKEPIKEEIKSEKKIIKKK